MSSPLPRYGREIPDADHRPPFDAAEARRRWQSCSDGKQRAIIEAAFDGRALGEGIAGNLALGWAWVVLGPPWARRRKRLRDYVLMLLQNAGTNGFSYWIRMGGGPEYDFVPMVRQAAEVVENAY